MMAEYKIHTLRKYNFIYHIEEQLPWIDGNSYLYIQDRNLWRRGFDNIMEDGVINPILHYLISDGFREDLFINVRPPGWYLYNYNFLNRLIQLPINTSMVTQIIVGNEGVINR